MKDAGSGPTGRYDEGDANFERAASDLRGRLRELAASVDPLPRFMGIGSIQAMEVEPDRAAGPDRGCVVVCPDGELNEPALRFIPGPVDVGGVDQAGDVRSLELPPGEYAACAPAAVKNLTAILEERER